MKKRSFCAALCILAAFVLWTAAVSAVDVRPIGPDGTRVGLAALNTFVRELTGVHMSLYILTDLMSLIPLIFAAGFAALGLGQWIRRKALWRVERSILALGVFYVAVGAVYIFFESFIVNYRPVLIEGRLEASYPSSTTVLVLCVMQSALMNLKNMIKRAPAKRWAEIGINAFTVFMLAARLISGVHWFSDIVGGILLSEALVLMYYSLM